MSHVLYNTLLPCELEAVLNFRMCGHIEKSGSVDPFFCIRLTIVTSSRKWPGAHGINMPVVKPTLRRIPSNVLPRIMPLVFVFIHRRGVRLSTASKV